MSFQIQFRQQDDILWFDAVGDVTHDGIVELAGVIRRECDAANCPRAIVDCQKMEGALSPGNIYFATQEFVRIIGGRTRVAYINPPDHWAPADDRFSRDVAHNHGGSLELFASVDDAIAWVRDNPHTNAG